MCIRDRFLTCSFFILGTLLKNYIVDLKVNFYLFILSILVFGLIVFLTDARIDFNRRVYDAPVFATLAAMSGCYFVVTLSFFISKSKALSFIPIILGKASLYILIFHVVIGNKTYKLMSRIQIEDEPLILISFSSFMLSIFVPVLLKHVVERSSLLSLFFLPLASNKIYQAYKFKISKT